MTDKLAAMKTLIQEINKHNHNYYTLDQPAISDAEWDALYDKLPKLEQGDRGYPACFPYPAGRWRDAQRL